MKEKIMHKVKWFVLALVVIVVEQLPILLVKKGKEPWQVALICLLFLAITLAILILAKKAKLLSSDAFSKGDQVVLWVGLGFAAMIIVKILGSIILTIEKGGHANTANQAALEQANLPAILLVILAAVVAPVVEEVVFRGLILGKVFGAGSYLGLIVSSFLFGGLHSPSDIGSWVIYGGMGLVLGFVYMKTKKLEYSILIHFVNNGLGVLFMLLMPYLK
ncbi:lysostaphin resistance A-like protein [Streptococcus iniae]